MKILYDPRPRTTEEIFSEEDNARFFSDHEIFQIDEDNAEQQYSDGYPKSTSSLVSRPWIEADWRAQEA